MTWAQFLTYAQSSLGIAAIVGVVIFALSEYVPGFGKHIENPKMRRLAVIGLSLVVPVVALVLEVTTVTYVRFSVGMVWEALYAGAASFGVATGVHTLVMSNKKKVTT